MHNITVAVAVVGVVDKWAHLSVVAGMVRVLQVAAPSLYWGYGR